MTDPDDLFTMKNQLWVGNYDTAISEATALAGLSDGLQIERDVYMYRAYIGKGQASVVLDRVPQSASTAIALNAVKLLASYVQGAVDKDIVMLTLNEWMADHMSSSDPHLLYVAGFIYGQEKAYSQALSALNKGNTLEHRALIVQIYLSMHRLDMASKELAKMRAVDEDHTMTQLASAWVYLHGNEDKLEEAALYFQELGARFGNSSLLLNGAAVAFLRLQNLEEAERLISEASSKGLHADTFINSIVLWIHSNKPKEEVNSLVQNAVASLAQIAPQHPWLQQYSELDQGFDQLAASYA